jgi:hypothetical protein
MSTEFFSMSFSQDVLTQFLRDFKAHVYVHAFFLMRSSSLLPTGLTSLQSSDLSPNMCSFAEKVYQI